MSQSQNIPADGKSNARKAKRVARKPWRKPRHTFWTRFGKLFLGPITRKKYHVSILHKPKDYAFQSLILYNHQTSLDQFIVGSCFPQTIYYVATEDIFSMGLVSKLLNYALRPIPISKTAMDFRAVMTCRQVAAEGGTIALAPEGNRTFDGRTCHIKPEVVKLCRLLKLPVVLLSIRGGYGVEPRWCKDYHQGRMEAVVSRVISPGEIASLSDAELYAVIRDNLFRDESGDHLCFSGEQPAEYVERLLYVCPFCGLTTFYSDKNRITCTKCNRSVIASAASGLTGDGFDLPFTGIGEWVDMQNDFVTALPPDAYTDTPAFTDSVSLLSVCLYKSKKHIMSRATLSLYSDRMTFRDDKDGTELNFPFAEVGAVAVQGRTKFGFATNDGTFQVLGTERFNAVKYMNFYYHSKGEFVNADSVPADTDSALPERRRRQFLGF